MTAVRKQVKNIHHLKKSLPEYQVAHEKAVFKAAAIVADTKKVVKDIDVQVGILTMTFDDVILRISFNISFLIRNSLS